MREVLVYADWAGLGETRLMGTLHSEMLRGKEIFSFEYHRDWLDNPYAQVLDPELHLFTGKQYLNDGEKMNFGLFLDSAPDRWGRVLMQRKEAALARLEERRPRVLQETDYLLGVYDGHRMGALRFKTDREGPFLNNDAAMATPPWASIRTLEEISLKLEEEKSYDEPEYLKWLNMLMSPGSSLGGARPKASVVDPDGQLWIAKFPSKSDRDDIGAWEMVAYEMARLAGIDMAESRARKFSSTHHTFLTKRFDRLKEGSRIHFSSAMTQLAYTDGADSATGVSYLELVEFITSHGATVERDLEELWRRIVFSVCISNCDDHLRNHGFLLQENGWALSPAFDLNPNETGTGLKLNIDETDNSLSLDLAMEVHPYFRLSASRAKEIIGSVKASVGHWREIASKYGISKQSQELKAPAFRIPG